MPHYLRHEQAMVWAAAQRTGSSGTKSVLMFLAWALYDVKWRALSQTKIAEAAEVSGRSVSAHLETLERMGLIRCIRRPYQPAVIELLASWGEAVPAEGPSSSRFIGTEGTPEHLLFDWILTQDPAGVLFRDIGKRGPVQTRSTAAAEDALKTLRALGHVEEVCQRPRRVRLTTDALGDRTIQTSELPL